MNEIGIFHPKKKKRHKRVKLCELIRKASVIKIMILIQE